ncbi:MAG TPA: tyrosinase family protein [Chitinophagaceae bacterium]
MKCRKNVKKLSPTEKTKFINAFLALKSQDSVLHPGSQSRYDDFVETHLLAMWDFGANAMRAISWGHSNSVFLPWHRELLYQFEKLLQTVDATVTIPYWDWTRAQAPGDAGYPFTHDFIGVDGDDSDGDRVKKEPGAPSPYPYAFNPETWSADVNVIDPGDTLNFFQRQFGEFNIAGTNNDAPNLPENDVTVVGTQTNFRAAIDGTIGYTTLRARSEDLHNLVHRWTGGNMLRMTSPNDPVFFMHHAQIDRMWSIWQKKVAPGTSLYVESTNAAGHKLNDAMIFNEAGDPSPFTIGATPAQMINGHTMHGDGVWYDSDIPDIDSPAPSLDFIGIPEGLTSYKAVKFKIKGGRKVKFRITSNPTGQFGVTSMGLEFEADPIDADDFYYGFVWVQLVAIAGPIANSSVGIHAYITDEEGYYAATEGGEFALGDYTITLTATTVAREDNAIALVLDRSGSMMAPAGGTSTRSGLLGDAIEVFRTLMLPGDEVSVTTFDDVVDTPIPMQVVNGAPAFSTVDITPRNTTWIGGGIQQGVLQLAAATHSNKSMIVLTDGNENVHPYIGELPAGTITNRTYAIGFGLPGEVSDAALNQITSNTNGDLIITGNMSSAEQQFNLTKYFVQVLAGVTNSQVILDPTGKLYYGSKDIVPFKVTEADVYVDAITLCPIPAYLEFILQTPGGKLIRPNTVEPNVQYIQGQQVLCYRMVLPALAGDAGGSHAGTWNAIIALRDTKAIAALANRKSFATNAVSPAVNGFLPYSFLVHCTSNLQLNAWKIQDSFKPGAEISLYAVLKEYDVPVTKSVSVWADITRPDQSTFTLKLSNVDEIFAASFTTNMTGLYTCRLRAEGISSKGMPYTREKTLTAGIYYGNYDAVPKPNPGDLLCDLLHCVFEEHEVFTAKSFQALQGLGIDLKKFIQCVKEVCPHTHEMIHGMKHQLDHVSHAKPQTVSQVKFKKAVPVKAYKPKAAKKPVSRDAMRAQQIHHTMFTAIDLATEEKRTSKSAGKSPGKTGGHHPGSGGHHPGTGGHPHTPPAHPHTTVAQPHAAHTMFMALDLKKEEKRVAGKQSKGAQHKKRGK